MILLGSYFKTIKNILNVGFSRGIFFYVVLCCSFFLQSDAPANQSVFRGNKVGVKVGVSQYDTQLKVLTVAGDEHIYDSLSLSGHGPMFGMQFEFEIPQETAYYTGLILGMTKGMNHVQARLSSTVPDTYFKASLLHTIEAAFQFGVPLAEVFPFVKIGAVFGQWKIQGRSLGGHDNKRKYLPGFILGAGVDFKAGSNWILGGSADYMHYKKVKGEYATANGDPSFSHWSAKPALMNMSVHLKRKL